MVAHPRAWPCQTIMHASLAGQIAFSLFTLGQGRSNVKRIKKQSGQQDYMQALSRPFRCRRLIDGAYLFSGTGHSEEYCKTNLWNGTIILSFFL